MANDFDESQIKWHDSPKFDESQVKWRDSNRSEEEEELPKTGQNFAGDMAAALRGAQEGIPFARDIGAAANAYIGNPLTGKAPTGDFSKAKYQLEERNAELAKEHPWAYGAGEIAGNIGSTLLAPEFAGANILGKGAKAEEAAAKLLTPMLGSPVEAKLISSLGSGMVGGAAQGALHGLGTGTDWADRLQHATGDTIAGAIAGTVGSAIGHGAARGVRNVGERLGLAKPIAPRSSAAELKNLSTQQFQQSSAANMRVRTVPLNDLYNDVVSSLRQNGYNPRNPRDEHRGIEMALETLRNVKNPQSLDQLDQIRRMTKTALLDWTNPEGRTMAKIFRTKLDNFLDTLTPTQTITQGSPTAALNAIKTARKYYNQHKKLDALEIAETVAKNNAGSKQVGGNFDNEYRSELKKILNKIDRKNDWRWSSDEIGALRQVVRGGATVNLARILGKFSPTHGGGNWAMLHALLSPLTGIPLAAAGYGAKKLEDRLTRDTAKNFEEIVAGGGKKATPRIDPMESVQGRAIGVPTMTSPLLTAAETSPVYAEDREERASGGRLGSRDYPAKRLSRVERAAKRAMDAIAFESKPLMDQPDQVIADALKLASQK